jgi:sulfocyanin SoxE-like protein
VNAENAERPRLTLRSGRPRALALGGVLLSAAVLAAACGGSPNTAAPTTGTTPSTTGATPSTTGSSGSGGTLAVNPSQWLTVDSATKSARLVLDAAHGRANSGFNFNSYANGQLVVTIPTGWKVTVSCTNEASALNHSCAIVNNAGDTTPAFPGASTPNPTTGLAPGQSASFEFTPTTTGPYRIDCLVPGHDPAGMWGTLNVVSSGTPSITAGSSSAGNTVQNS